MTLAHSQKLPVLFLGHGSPMYAIEPNEHTAAWEALGKTMQKPKAILAISAHWLTRGVWLTAMKQPPTIHDFGGFPEALFKQQYPAPGSPELAKRVANLVEPLMPATLEEEEWGLDHGTWSVLKYVYPNADVPIVQMSINAQLSEQEHYDLAKALKPLRDEGILIVASGNVVHNLRTIDWHENAKPLPWATQFNDYFKDRLAAHDLNALIHWRDAGEMARMSVPSPDHYWPLLYILGASDAQEPIHIVTDGIELGSISMLSFAIGNIH